MTIKQAARKGLAEVWTDDGYRLTELRERRTLGGRRTSVVDAVWTEPSSGKGGNGVFNGDLTVDVK
jgi:hypothetical protein